MSQPKKARQPQDHRPKKAAVERLRDEATAEALATIGRKIVLSGRRGDVTVTVLDDPLEWGIEASELIEEWSRRDPESGGIKALELKRFLMAVVSVADADRIRAIEPTSASLSQAADAILDSGDSGAEGEPSLGESQAS